jgi:sulfite reductase alpha subunit-like flavoprotein
MQLADLNAVRIFAAELLVLLAQSLPKVQPGYFSIASSPKLAARQAAATVGTLVT